MSRYVRLYTSTRSSLAKCRDSQGLGYATLDCDTVRQVDLRQRRKFLGHSNHSYVFLAPLTLSSGAAMPTVRGGVVVKIARAHCEEDCDMFTNEAEFYDSFAGVLQGCDSPSPPIFYGYYFLSLESINHYKEDESTVLRDVLNFLLCLTPMLLLEYCGTNQ